MTTIDNSKIFLGGIYTDADVYVAANTTYYAGTVLGRNVSGDLVGYSTDNNVAAVAAERAIGELTFTGTAETTVPMGTKVKTSGNVEFETTESGTIPTGETTVTIPARAVAVGTSGNIAANTTLSLVAAVSGISAVANSAAFKGGVNNVDSYVSQPIYILAQDIANATGAAIEQTCRVYECGDVDASKLTFVKSADKTNVAVLDALKTNGYNLVNVQQLA